MVMEITNPCERNAKKLLFGYIDSRKRRERERGGSETSEWKYNIIEKHRGMGKCGGMSESINMDEGLGLRERAKKKSFLNLGIENEHWEGMSVILKSFFYVCGILLRVLVCWAHEPFAFESEILLIYRASLRECYVWVGRKLFFTPTNDSEKNWIIETNLKLEKLSVIKLNESFSPAAA